MVIKTDCHLSRITTSREMSNSAVKSYLTKILGTFESHTWFFKAYYLNWLLETSGSYLKWLLTVAGSLVWLTVTFWWRTAIETLFLCFFVCVCCFDFVLLCLYWICVMNGYPLSCVFLLEIKGDYGLTSLRIVILFILKCHTFVYCVICKSYILQVDGRS